ncbi:MULTISPECIES: universal stress protein [unclassified Streptomyces]|uniref:universal stress protein n=1 Tax=unclassified Streptomyces TaxID=2593676 RepID=UPI000700C7F9|nr:MULTISPECIES: universal stress protein [unclassified Streptomyces]KQX46254.1 universal stress protein UspA [Streptomyces sp. Root1304]KRA81039.1 universal stress protein UspA [Streptomyces sp. Root66D1]
MTSEIPARPELGNVVVGVDGSPSGRTAVLWAAAEADRRGRPLRLVHAADTDRRALFANAETIQAVREAGRDLLIETESTVREHFPDLAVTKELSRQEPVAGLRATAGHRGTIVVGSRGLGGFSSLMLGSVGMGVAARAEAPVIVVRGDSDRPESGSVTAAVHGASDVGWLLVAAAEADARKAVLRLVSVWNVLTHVGSVATMLDDLDEIARRRVHEVKVLADRVRDFYPGLIVSHHVETGTSTPGILVEASAHTDLLVMGREHRVLGAGPSLGRVAHVLLHHAHCPVEIVPPAFATRVEES